VWDAPAGQARRQTGDRRLSPTRGRHLGSRKDARQRTNDGGQWQRLWPWCRFDVTDSGGLEP